MLAISHACFRQRLCRQLLADGDFHRQLFNGSQDFYLWKDRTLTRLPGEPLAGSEANPEDVGPFLSHDGSTVAFVTPSPLLPQDGDTTADVYVAREGGEGKALQGDGHEILPLAARVNRDLMRVAAVDTVVASANN